MKNFLKKEKSPQELFKELRVKEYINKYIKELQRHFDMSDRKMREILYVVYKELSPYNFIKTWFCMIKSKYIDNKIFKGTKDGD